jgi:HD-like signal output (HDOD) protein
MITANEIIYKEKIQSMKDLPSLTASVVELIRYVCSDEIEMPKLYALLQHDPVIVAKMMRLVNSSQYGLPKKIETIEMMANYLGINKVKEIILNATVMDSINTLNSELWDHSFKTSLLLSQIVAKERLKFCPKVTLMALLHDIGQIVMNLVNPKAEKLVKQKMKQASYMTLSEVEKEIIGIDHALAGSWLLEIWGLDEDIYLPIAYHHNYEEVNEKYLREIAILQIVDFIEESSSDQTTRPVPQVLLDYAGLEYIDFDYWISLCKKL